MEIKKERERMENEKREAIKKGEIERDNEELKCGLCKTTVYHWKQHIKSDRHIKKQLDEFIQETNTSQETIFQLTKAIKKGKQMKCRRRPSLKEQAWKKRKNTKKKNNTVQKKKEKQK